MKKPTVSIVIRSLLLLSAFCAGCTSVPRLMPESTLAAQATTEFNRMKAEMPLATDPAKIARVNQVGRRIADVANPYIDNPKWEFVLFEDPAVNAFAMPGGKIGVFTGLLDLSSSDDELAVVMSHEVAHVLLQHGNQRVSAELMRGAGAAILAYGTREQSDSTRAMILAAYGAGTQVGAILPFSRHNEHQADEVGLYIMVKAGYDPHAAITFWQKMAAQSGDGGPPEFLSTHPHYDNRIQRLRQTIPEAQENPPMEQVIEQYK